MDKYQVEPQSFAGGNFGKVFKGIRISDNKPICIKVILKNDLQNPNNDYRLEVKNLMELDHPYIVKYIDHFEDAEHVFLVTEFLEGKDLGLFLRTQTQPLKETFVLGFIRKLFHAVLYCHINNIIHRDIKLANIMVIKNPITNEFNPKLFDFGFSKNIQSSNFIATSFKGTGIFMAPEILTKLPYSFEADIFSLGVVTFYLLAFKHPWGEYASFEDLLRAIQSNPINPINVAYSPALLELPSLMLKVKISERITWEELINKKFLPVLLK